MTTPGTEVDVPGQAAELTSVGQLEPDEELQIRQRRARRALSRPQKKLSELDPKQQLAECKRLIREADEQREATMREARERSTAAFFDTAGPYLLWVRQNELNRLEELTFEEWAHRELGYKGSHTYLIMDGVEVRAALGIAGSDEYQVRGITLNTGHVRALAPAIRAKGPDVASQMWDRSLDRTGKVTEATLRETWRSMASEVSEESNQSFDSADLAAARRRVNDDLKAAVKQLDNLVDRLDGLIESGVAPHDAAAAEKAVAKIKAAGRHLSSKKMTVPKDRVVEAELVEE